MVFLLHKIICFVNLFTNSVLSSEISSYINPFISKNMHHLLSFVGRRVEKNEIQFKL